MNTPGNPKTSNPTASAETREIKEASYWDAVVSGYIRRVTQRRVNQRRVNQRLATRRSQSQ